MNKTLKKNLDAIRIHSPGIVKWIEEDPEVDWAEEIKCDTGEPNLLISAGSDMMPAHPMERPYYEALKAAKTYKYSADDITILIGIGMGYMTKAILKRMGKAEHHVVVVESSGDMVRRAFSHFNFSEHLKKQTLIITGPTKVDATLVLSVLEQQITVENWYMIAEVYCAFRPLEYAQLATDVAELINQMRCGTGTVIGSGFKMADNDIECLPFVIRHRGINELKGLFKDKPVVTVSTGPSLARNIHILKEIQDKVYIIAVGQALRPLLAHDIRPDLICTVDFGETNYGHYRGVLHSDVPLIAHNRAYAPLLRNYQGPIFVSAGYNPGFENTAAGIIMEKGTTESGGSVAHLCLAAAHLMGGKPIIMIGQDLALTGQSHFAQADESGTLTVENGLLWWEVTDPRSKLKERGRISMGPATTVSGYFGKPVLTNSGLASFITSFQILIQMYSKDTEVINATEGGASIKGAEPMFLKEAANQYCTKKVDKSILDPLLTPAENADELIEEVIPRLKKDIANLESVIKNSKKGLDADDKIKKTILMKDKKRRANELEGLLSANHKFSTKAQNAAAQNMLVGLAIFGAQKMIQKQAGKVDGSPEHLSEDMKDLKIRVDRNALILTAARDASISLKKSYKETLHILEEYWKTKNVSLLSPKEEEPIILDDAEECFAVGNWAKPLLEARKYMDSVCDRMVSPRHGYKDEDRKTRELALDIIKKAEAIRNKETQNMIENLEKEDLDNRFVQVGSLIEKARRLGQKKEYDKAILLLKEAVEILPDHEQSRWGLATVLTFMGKHEESAKQFKKLVKQYPKNHRYRFEYGQVILRTGDVKLGLKVVGKAMEETNEYNSFFAKIGDLYAEGDMHKEALLAYDTYLDQFRSDFMVWTKRGIVLRNLGRKKEAMESFKKSQSIKPNWEMNKAAMEGKEIVI